MSLTILLRLIPVFGLMALPLAAVTIYADRAAFNSAAPGLPVETFEAGRVLSGGIADIGPNLDATTNNAFFLPGEILPGVRFHAVQGLSIENNWAFAPTTSLHNSSDEDGLFIWFSGSPVHAVGFDALGQFTENAPTNLIAYDALGRVITTVSITPPGSGVFVGIVSETAIDHLFYEVGFGTRGVDNFSFGAASSTPEPATVGAGLCSLALILARLRRGRL